MAEDPSAKQYEFMLQMFEVMIIRISTTVSGRHTETYAIYSPATDCATEIEAQNQIAGGLSPYNEMRDCKTCCG